MGTRNGCGADDVSGKDRTKHEMMMRDVVAIEWYYAEEWYCFDRGVVVMAAWNPEKGGWW